MSVIFLAGPNQKYEYIESKRTDDVLASISAFTHFLCTICTNVLVSRLKAESGAGSSTSKRRFWNI